MRFLFVMPFPGFLRYFDSVVLQLADRGHRVDLVWEKPTRQPEGLRSVSGNRSVKSFKVPTRKDSWRAPIRRVRILANYIRYLDRRFADTEYLRRRAASRMPRPLRHIRTLPDPIVRRLIDFVLGLEGALPRSHQMDEFLSARAPDAVIVSPLVRGASVQNDVLASARALGLPTVGAIASWDNLTNKSIVLVQPDRMLVWNETQRREASELHRYPPERVVVTGAQCFDRWFGREPSRSRELFCERLGLPPNGRFLLFVGSTASIFAPDAEVHFVREWLRFLASDDELGSLFVLVRPHPYNSSHWNEADLSEFEQARLWPGSGADPVDEDDRSDYFDSLYYADVVVGINTSAMIEAAIIGRPVLTLGVDELHEAQRETLHFRYLLPENGGFVQAASSFEEHVVQLKNALANPDATRDASTAFVRSFIRPAGLDEPATGIVVTALEDLAASKPDPVAKPPLRTALFRAILALFALPELPRLARERIASRPWPAPSGNRSRSK